MKKLTAALCLVSIVVLSCKKETVSLNNTPPKKVFFYLEEINKNGDTSKTSIVTVSVPSN